jgi:hypothetical protein
LDIEPQARQSSLARDRRLVATVVALSSRGRVSRPRRASLFIVIKTVPQRQRSDAVRDKLPVKRAFVGDPQPALPRAGRPFPSSGDVLRSRVTVRRAGRPLDRDRCRAASAALQPGAASCPCASAGEQHEQCSRCSGGAVLDQAVVGEVAAGDSHSVILASCGWRFFVLSIVACFAILITGRYFDLNLGVLRWR